MIIDLGYQFLQASLHIFIFAAGLVICISVGASANIFGGCVLYANMTVDIVKNGSLVWDPRRTKFGPEEKCWYTMSIGILALVYAIFWLWYYILMRGWSTKTLQKRSRKKTKHFVPTLLFSLLLFLCSFVAACIMTFGLSSWCQRLRGRRRGTRPTCDLLGKQSWGFPEQGKDAYWYMRSAELFAWLLTIALGALVVILVVWFREIVVSWYTSLKAAEGQQLDIQDSSTAESHGAPSARRHSYTEIPGSSGAGSSRQMDLLLPEPLLPLPDGATKSHAVKV